MKHFITVSFITKRFITKYRQVVILPWLLCLWQGQLLAQQEILIPTVTKQQANALKTINSEAENIMHTRKTLSYKIVELKDSRGQIYLGGLISKAELSPYLKQLETVLGDEFNGYRHNQALRDHHVFHVTLVSPIEYQTITKELLAKVANSQQQNFTLNLLGLGKVSAGDKTAFFVVGESSQGQFYRQQLLLRPKDFHVTLGFKPHDVYGVGKGKNTLL